MSMFSKLKKQIVGGGAVGGLFRKRNTAAEKMAVEAMPKEPVGMAPAGAVASPGQETGALPAPAVDAAQENPFRAAAKKVRAEVVNTIAPRRKRFGTMLGARPKGY